MLETALSALLDEGRHLILSGSRPLALQRGASLLLQRLNQSPQIRLTGEAPVEAQALIEHFNRIVADLSLSQATGGSGSALVPAVLPVRVSADRPADSVALLARLCRALPGADVRLLLIVEHAESLADCLSLLGARALHLDVTPESLSDPPQTTPEPSGYQSESHASSDARADAAPIAKPGWFASVVDSASRRPLRFALFAIGIPGLLIAAILAIGLARGPSSTGKPTEAKNPENRLVPKPAPSPGPAPGSAQTSSQPAPAATPPAASVPPKPVQQATAASASAPAKPAPDASPQPGPSSTAAAQAAVAMPGFNCSPPGSAPPQAQARNPTKDAGMVYLVATRPMSVCVADASGKPERFELAPDKGRSIYGKPPWQIHSPGLADLQIFFQGSRIVLPRGATDRVELTEQRPSQ